ncbi:MAG: hypothetical protein ACRCZF_01030 [Gemmataceae bacterium]
MMMLRAAVGVFLGYMVMALCVFAGLTGAYFLLGPDRAFQPGTFQVTNLWIGVWFGVSLLAAICGGLSAVKLGRTPRAGWILAGIVVVLGLLSAVMKNANAPAGAGAVRTGETPNMQAMMMAESPVAIDYANPVLGFIGVALGVALAPRAK